MANKHVMTANDRSALPVSTTPAGSGKPRAKNLPSAANEALAARDTSKRNPIATTIVADQKRVLMAPMTPRPGLVVTPQTVLSASCNFPKHPRAQTGASRRRSSWPRGCRRRRARSRSRPASGLGPRSTRRTSGRGATIRRAGWGETREYGHGPRRAGAPSTAQATGVRPARCARRRTEWHRLSSCPAHARGPRDASPFASVSRAGSYRSSASGRRRS